MGQTITFFPEGNAECIFLELDNGKRMLMDYANMHSSDSRYTDLTESLKDIDTFDVVMFTHPHDDHVKGAADFFYFDHAVKYQTGERAKIKELWVSAAFLLDVNPCEDARVIRQEARYRLKECGGKGVKIFASPGSLASWLEKHELSTNENDHPIIHAGTLLDSSMHDLGAEISIFVHAPFSEDAEDADSRNDPSIVIQIALDNTGQTTNIFITGDTPHDVLDKIGAKSRWILFGELGVLGTVFLDCPKCLHHFYAPQNLWKPLWYNGHKPASFLSTKHSSEIPITAPFPASPKTAL